MTRAQLAARLRAALPGWTVTERGPWVDFYGAKKPGYIALIGPRFAVVVPSWRKFSGHGDDWHPLPSGRGWPERFAADLLAAHAARGGR